jgi:hypothetical protein
VEFFYRPQNIPYFSALFPSYPVEKAVDNVDNSGGEIDFPPLFSDLC